VTTDFASLFTSFQRSAFRLEIRDRYNVPEETEPFRLFLQGRVPDPSWTREWTQVVSANTSAGKVMRRVRLVREPLSDYLRFELSCGYPNNVTAGEQIAVLVVQSDPPQLPAHDFWLFDDSAVGVMSYDDGGHFLGVQVVTEPQAVARYCRSRDLALELAMPYSQYIQYVTTVSS